MFHYNEPVQNTKGDALIGYYVKIVNPTTGEVVNIFADNNSTPISSVSGIANACKVNSDGMASFYVADGEYHIDVYATDGATFVRRNQNIPMAKVGLLRAATVAELANLDTGYPAILTLSGSQGIFVFDSSDLSIQVAADPSRLTYVARASDITGASGAWVRMSGQASQQTTALNSIVSGCNVAYRNLLIFDMSAGSYYLDGIFHTAAAQSITLAAADGTNPRIDVLYLDTAGVLQKTTGTPAASPSKPSVDPSTQLELTFVLVPAAAASLTAVTTDDIYLENTEWTTSQSGTALTLASTNNPYAGTKDIETTGTFVTGNYVNFARATPVAFGGDGNLILRIRSKVAWNAKRLLTVQFRRSGANVGSAPGIRSGAFGFDSSNITGYQVVIIPKSQFAIAAGTEIDELRITCAGSGNSVPSFYMDNVQLQTNGTAIGNQDLTQSIADARYVNVTGDTMTGALYLPASAYDATLWNGSLKAATEDAVRDKIEALAPGGVISGALLIANNLSDLSNAGTARTNMGLGSIATFAEGTAAQYRANTAAKALSTDKVWSAADYVALTDAVTVAVDMSAGINFSLTIGGNRTLGAPTNMKAGQTGCIVITQDATGSRTLAYNAAWLFAGGTDPVLSTAASTKDVLFYQVLPGATTVLGNLVKAIA